MKVKRGISKLSSRMSKLVTKVVSETKSGGPKRESGGSKTRIWRSWRRDLGIRESWFWGHFFCTFVTQLCANGEIFLRISETGNRGFGGPKNDENGCQSDDSGGSKRGCYK